MLSGWGRVEEGGDWSRTLKRARMPIVTDQECTRNVRKNFTLVALCTMCTMSATSSLPIIYSYCLFVAVSVP